MRALFVVIPLLLMSGCGLYTPLPPIYTETDSTAAQIKTLGTDPSICAGGDGGVLESYVDLSNGFLTVSCRKGSSVVFIERDGRISFRTDGY